MHESVMEFGRSVIAAADVRGKRVIEVGSMNVNGSLRGHIESLQPASYVGIDFMPGVGVDVICDASRLSKLFGHDIFDIVVSTEMLEHAKDWRVSISSMKQILVSGGLLVLTARGPGFKRHGYPHDWHRFTVHDMRRIFADFQIDSLESDRQCPGVLLRARKPSGWHATVDLGTIDVAPADEQNAPR